MDDLDFVGLNCADWTGVFAHHHTDDDLVDWQGQPTTHGIEEHIEAMKASVEPNGGGAPPQITSHLVTPDQVRVGRMDLRDRGVSKRCPHGDRGEMEGWGDRRGVHLCRGVNGADPPFADHLLQRIRSRDRYRSRRCVCSHLRRHRRPRRWDRGCCRRRGQSHHDDVSRRKLHRGHWGSGRAGHGRIERGGVVRRSRRHGGKWSNGGRRRWRHCDHGRRRIIADDRRLWRGRQWPW